MRQEGESRKLISTSRVEEPVACLDAFSCLCICTPALLFVFFARDVNICTVYILLHSA